jgi:hypothetical protein
MWEYHSQCDSNQILYQVKIYKNMYYIKCPLMLTRVHCPKSHGSMGETYIGWVSHAIDVGLHQNQKPILVSCCLFLMKKMPIHVSIGHAYL